MFPARGLAVGDYNNDGRVDVLIGNNGGAPVLLKNNAGEGNHWVGIKLQGTACNRDAIGATITWSVNGKTRSRLKTHGGSYLSSHDMREVLGLGTAAKADWVEIKWPQPSGARRAAHRHPRGPLRHHRRRQGLELEPARAGGHVRRPLSRHALDAHLPAAADAHVQRDDVTTTSPSSRFR